MKVIAMLLGATLALAILVVTVLAIGLGTARSGEGPSPGPGSRPDPQPEMRAEYDPARLTAGIGAAAVLLATAGWLVRATDWSTVGEAAAPEIDGATYADLDAIIAGLEDPGPSADVTRRGPPTRLSQ